MTQKSVDELLIEKVGVENFKGSYERLIPIFAPLKTQLKRSGVKIITIAGTNGKGETAHLVAKALSVAGYKVAQFTSPHILSVVERFQFNGAFVEKNLLRKLILKTPAESMSYFEYIFLLFCYLCTDYWKPQFLVLEVGLGGRLDATNILDADLAAITSISRDHQAILGKRYQNILLEKLGIARSNALLITNFELQYLRNITNDYAKVNQIPWRDLFVEQKSNHLHSYVERNNILAAEIVKYFIPNAVTGIDAPSKGRREEMTSGRNRFIFIGAHNLDGIRKLSNKSFYQELELDRIDAVLFSFSQREESDLKGMVKALKLIFPDELLWPCIFEHKKALDKSSMEKLCADYDLPVPQKLELAFEKSRAFEEKRYLVLGSYYFIGEFQQYLLRYS